MEPGVSKSVKKVSRIIWIAPNYYLNLTTRNNVLNVLPILDNNKLDNPKVCDCRENR